MDYSDDVKIPAVFDLSVLLEQANLAYSAWEAEKDRNPKTAELWMGIAALLFHLEDGSYEMFVNIPKANKGVY